MKFGQLIEHPKRNIFFKTYAENEAQELVPDRFLFFKKALHQVKASGLQLDFTIFRQPSNQHTVDTNCLNIYTIVPEICSTLIFQIWVWEQFLQHILRMIFQRKCSSCYILLPGQISLPGCLYFLIYQAIYVLQLFVNKVVMSCIQKLT